MHIARALWLAITRGPRLAWLSYSLWELEAWITDIERDYALNGLAPSRHLSECRAQAASLRVQIALLQPARQEEGTQ